MLAFALIYLSYFLSLFIVPYFLTLFFSIHFRSIEFGEYCFPTATLEEERNTVDDRQDQPHRDPPSYIEEDDGDEVEGYQVDFQVLMNDYCGSEAMSVDLDNNDPHPNQAANNQHPPPIIPSRTPDALNLPQPSDGPSSRPAQHVATPTSSLPPQAFYPYMVTPHGALIPPIILYHAYPFCNMPLDYFKKLYEQCRQQLIMLALSNDDPHTHRVKLIFGETHRPFRLARKEKESSRKVNRYYPYRRRSMNERSRLRQGIKGWPYSLERLWGFRSKSKRRTRNTQVPKLSDILLEPLFPENLLRKKRLESPPPPFPSILNNAYAPIPSSTPDSTFLHPPKNEITQLSAKALGKRPCRDWDHGNEENSDISAKQTRRKTVEAEFRGNSPSFHKSKSDEFVITKPPTVLPDKRRYSQRRSPSPSLGRQAGSRKKRRLTENHFLEISELPNEKKEKGNKEEEEKKNAPCTPPRHRDSTPELSNTPGGEEETEVLVTPPQPSSNVVGEEVQVVSPILQGEVSPSTSPTQSEVESNIVQVLRRRKNRPAPLVLGGYFNPAEDTPAPAPTRAGPRAATLLQQPQMVKRDTWPHFMAPSLDGYTHSPTTAMFLDGPANMAGGEVESESGDEPGQGKRKWKPNKLRRLMTHLPYLQPTSPSPATNFLHSRRHVLVQHIQKLLAEKPVVPEAVSVVPPPFKQPDPQDPPLPISPLASNSPKAKRALNPYDLKPWPRKLPKQDPASVNYTFEFLRTIPEPTRVEWAKETDYARVLREKFHHRALMQKEEREVKEAYGEMGDFMRALQNTSDGDALGIDQSSGGRKQLRRTQSSRSISGENAQAGPSKRSRTRSGTEPSTPAIALGSPFQGDVGSIIASEYALASPSIVPASVIETVSSPLRHEDPPPAGIPLPFSNRPTYQLNTASAPIPPPTPPNDLIPAANTASSVVFPSEPVQESRGPELSTHTSSSTPSPRDNANIESQETIFITPSSESTVEAKDVPLEIAEKESIVPEETIPTRENIPEEVADDETVERDTHDASLATLSSQEEQGTQTRSEGIGLTCSAPSIVELQNDTQTSIAPSEVEPKDNDETSISSISKSASSPSSADTSIIGSQGLETSSPDPKIAEESVLRAGVTEESRQMKFTSSFPTTSQSTSTPDQTPPTPSVAPAPPSPKPQAAVIESSEIGSDAPKSTFDFLTRPTAPTPLEPTSAISRAINRATSSSRWARGKTRSHGGAIRGGLGGLWAAHAARTANKANPPKVTKKTDDGGEMERQLGTALKEGETEMQDQDMSEVEEENQDQNMEIVSSDIQGSSRPTWASFPTLSSSFSTVHGQRLFRSQHQSVGRIRPRPRSPQLLTIFERRRNASAPSEVEDEMEVDEICEAPPTCASSTPPAYTHLRVPSPTRFNRFHPIAPQSSQHQASHQPPSSISSTTNEEVEMTNEDLSSNTAAHNQRGSSFAQQMYMPNIVSSYLAQLAHRPRPEPARFMEDTEMQEAIFIDTPTQPSFPSHPVKSNFSHNVAAPQPHFIPPAQATRVETLPPHLRFRQPASYDADQADEDEYEEVEIPDPPSSAFITNRMVRETESVRQGISSLSISDPETVSVDIVPEPSRATNVDSEIKITPPPSKELTSSRLLPLQVHLEQPVIADAAVDWTDPLATPRSFMAEMTRAEDSMTTSGTPAESTSTPQPILSTTLGNVIPTPIPAIVTSPSEDSNMPFSRPSIQSNQDPLEADLTFQNALEPRIINPLKASGHAASANMGLRMLASIAKEKEELDNDLIDMKAVEEVINGDEKKEGSERRSSREEKGKNKAVEVEGVQEAADNVEESTETLSYGDKELLDMLTSGPLPSWLAPESEPTVHQEPPITFFDQQCYDPTQAQDSIPSCLDSSSSTAPSLFDYNGHPVWQAPGQEQFAVPPPLPAVAPPDSPPSTPPPPAVEVATEEESDLIQNARSGRQRGMACINNTAALRKLSSQSSANSIPPIGQSLLSMSPVLTPTQMGKIDEEIDLGNFKAKDNDKANMPPPGFVRFPKQRSNQGSSGTSSGNFAAPPARSSSSHSAFRPVIGPSKSTLLAFPSSSTRSSEVARDSDSWESRTCFQAAKRGSEKAQEEEFRGRADIPIILPVLTPDLILEDTQGPLTRMLARLPARVRRALDAAATDAQPASTNIKGLDNWVTLHLHLRLTDLTEHGQGPNRQQARWITQL
ncbi:hypothetical protein L486_02767 [Kwoniella mangroviensis CBS 10435]|uniref:Uncharacterized protein n=1 Tax=Kwoniella mangroviensis CBS 10435 TaxID=1331196 RepID=A0A1B9IX34_9TREE|nr:hypothetical protein L486_02767 [Kwoniella mangroviensis CBS 10435]